jgi:hypothetical protein
MLALAPRLATLAAIGEILDAKRPPAAEARAQHAGDARIEY